VVSLAHPPLDVVVSGGRGVFHVRGPIVHAIIAVVDERYVACPRRAGGLCTGFQRQSYRTSVRFCACELTRGITCARGPLWQEPGLRSARLARGDELVVKTRHWRRRNGLQMPYVSLGASSAKSGVSHTRSAGEAASPHCRPWMHPVHTRHGAADACTPCMTRDRDPAHMDSDLTAPAGRRAAEDELCPTY